MFLVSITHLVPENSVEKPSAAHHHDDCLHEIGNDQYFRSHNPVVLSSHAGHSQNHEL